MNKYILTFNTEIYDLEKRFKWTECTELLYKQWKQNPDNMNHLLLAGTELWYILLEYNYYEDAPWETSYCNSFDKELALNRLIEITKYGEDKFRDNPIFNIYLGIMINVYPYFFMSRDDWEKWFSKGRVLVKRAFNQDPQSLFVQGLYYQLDDSKKELYDETCEKIWSTITPNQWGKCGVNQYFFYRLSGERFYPDAYENE